VNFILFAIVSGGIYFKEFQYFEPINTIGFIGGVILLVTGIFLLSPKMEKSSLEESAGEAIIEAMLEEGSGGNDGAGAVDGKLAIKTTLTGPSVSLDDDDDDDEGTNKQKTPRPASSSGGGGVSNGANATEKLSQEGSATKKERGGIEESKQQQPQQPRSIELSPENSGSVNEVSPRTPRTPRSFRLSVTKRSVLTSQSNLDDPSSPNRRQSWSLLQQQQQQQPQQRPDSARKSVMSNFRFGAVAAMHDTHHDQRVHKAMYVHRE
jgi:hypothetical protein